MERKVQQVIWTEEAAQALERIYTFHIIQSEVAAEKIINEIVEKADSIIYPEQYQVDYTAPQLRRMIVRDYKILYAIKGLTVFIVNILSTKKPDDVNYQF